MPLIRDALGGTGFCWLTASLILALQGVPTMTFVMNSAFNTISDETKEVLKCMQNVLDLNANINSPIGSHRIRSLYYSIMNYGREKK